MINFSKFFIFYVLVLLIVGFKGEVVISFCVVILHELVHYIVAKRFGYLGLSIKVMSLGTMMQLDDLDQATFKEDFIISISGPLFNLVCSALFYYIYMNIANYNLIYILYSTNLTLGVFNLIPALPLDGGRILRDILCKKNYYKKANNITTTISMGIGIIFLCLYFLLFYMNKTNIYNISIGLVAFLVIFYSINEKERAAYLIMSDIIKKRYKFLKKGYLENRSVSVYYKKDLLFLANMTEKNIYSIFYILNDDMEIINIINENEIIEALKKYGNISIEEYTEKL